MRRLVFALMSTASWLSLNGGAGAADLVTKARAPAPVPLWSGPYVGLDLGAYRHEASSIDETFGLVPGFSGSLISTSVFVSAHAGYNWQVSGNGQFSGPTNGPTVSVVAGA